MLVFVHEFVYLYGGMEEISSYFRSRYTMDALVTSYNNNKLATSYKNKQSEE